MEKNSRIEELKQQYAHAREIGESTYHDIADLLNHIYYLEAQIDKHEIMLQEIESFLGPSNFITCCKTA